MGAIGDYLVSSKVLEVPQPFALNGYYPLYITNFAAAAVNSTYHEHTINGHVYFMPDQGPTVPNFHGTHVPANTYEELGGFV